MDLSDLYNIFHNELDEITNIMKRLVIFARFVYNSKKVESKERGATMSEIFYAAGEALPKLTAAMLAAHSSADRETLSAVQCTAERLCVRTDRYGLPEDAVMRNAYLSLKEICFRIQRRIARTDELLCYENGVRQPESAVDLCRTLRHFVNQVDILTDVCMQIGDCEVPHELYARVLPERLNFVLAAMLERALYDIPDANVMDFRAGCVQSDLRIEMVLRHDPAVTAEPLLRPETSGEEMLLPDAPELLNDRFCRCFGARMLRHSAEEKYVCTLSLPAAAAAYPLGKVSSDSAKRQDDTLIQAVLAGFVPAEIMLTALSDLL